MPVMLHVAAAGEREREWERGKRPPEAATGSGQPPDRERN